MHRFIRRNILWGFYIIFLGVAGFAGAREAPLDFSAPVPLGKIAVWMIFIAFLVYSILAHFKESFFKSVGKVNSLWWGLQIGLDLYISVFLSLVVIYLLEGSLLVVVLWAVPVLIFANLAILPYIILNYGALLTLLGIGS